MKKLKLTSLEDKLFKTLEKEEMKSIVGGGETCATIRTFLQDGSEVPDTTCWEDDPPPKHDYA